MELILLHDKTIVSACLSCLGSVVDNVTRNFSRSRDHRVSYKKVHEKDPEDARLPKATAFFRRSRYTVTLHRHVTPSASSSNTSTTTSRNSTPA